MQEGTVGYASGGSRIRISILALKIGLRIGWLTSSNIIPKTNIMMTGWKCWLSCKKNIQKSSLLKTRLPNLK